MTNIEQNVECGAKLFDSHAHYYDQRFYGEECPEGAESLLERLFAQNVSGVINVGTDPASNARVIEQAQGFERMYGAIGFHPECAEQVREGFAEHMQTLSDLLSTPAQRKRNKLVAIGEIGLDYYWEPYDKALQRRIFEEQMSLAASLDLPVIIHDREAHGDCFDVVCAHKATRGVFHSYSGSPEMARELIKRGWYISFSGVVSFKNASRIKEVARVVPLERMLIETDAPYLAPHPYRGRINHSGLLLHTATALAQICGCDLEEIAERTEQNAKALFGITD